MFIGKYNGSVILTYLGVTLALVGMAFIVVSKAPQAMIALILAGICDLFDGQVASRFKRTDEEKAFGREIDSMADMISFVASPSLLGLVLAGTGPLSLIAITSYVLAAIIRLAYFNIAGVDETQEGRFYRGLPVTYAAMVFPILYLPLSFLPRGAFSILWSVVYLTMAAAFILDWKVPKPDRAMSLKLLGLAAVVCLIYGLVVFLK